MFERNPYLKRTHSDTPHTYNYDMQTGKLFLQHSGNVRELIHKTGKLPTKFKPLCSGFLSSKKRYEEAKTDKNLLHFVPESTYKRRSSLYTPITEKFVGYGQYPCQTEVPEYLEMPEIKPAKIEGFDRELQLSRLVRHHRRRRAMARRNLQLKVGNPQVSNLLNSSNPTKNYFQLSMLSLQKSKPFPKNRKRSCYDNRCRMIDNSKRFSIESAVQLNTKQRTHLNTTMAETINKTYFQNKILAQTKAFSP